MFCQSNKAISSEDAPGLPRRCSYAQERDAVGQRLGEEKSKMCGCVARNKKSKSKQSEGRWEREEESKRLLEVDLLKAAQNDILNLDGGVNRKTREFIYSTNILSTHYAPDSILGIWDLLVDK